VTGGLERWEIDPQLIKNPGTSLGTGSFGTVFKAELHGKPVAVKKLSTQKFDDKTLVRRYAHKHTHTARMSVMLNTRTLSRREKKSI
jgi:serine/threonine protein kinase